MCELEEASFVDDQISKFIHNGRYNYVSNLTVTVKQYQRDDDQMNVMNSTKLGQTKEEKKTQRLA